ncbi:MAG TPA: hypothetical protein VFC19_24665 [Candidatus Limnocylindrales bacterium]|nr:hypothetical protein [Candidatus Limnocylindrales bacterium]
MWSVPSPVRDIALLMLACGVVAWTMPSRFLEQVSRDMVEAAER